MTTEQQDLAWACLPKEAREKLKRAYKYQCQNSDYNRGFNEALEEVFGFHNLNSDTEPEELLMVEREKVQEVYSFNEAVIKNGPTHSGAWLLKKKLDYLFGDKCLPDKAEEIADKRTKPVKEHFEQPSVQAGPKFKVGDKVVAVNEAKLSYDGVMTVIEVKYVYNCVFYRVNEHPALFYEGCLEPYTEENKETMEEKELGSLDANFKRLNVILDKMQKTVAKIYDSYGKMCVAVDKLKRL